MWQVGKFSSRNFQKFIVIFPGISSKLKTFLSVHCADLHVNISHSSTYQCCKMVFIADTDDPLLLSVALTK